VKKKLSISFIAGAVVILLLFIISLFYIFPNQTRFTLLTIKDIGNQLASVILSHNFKTVSQIKKDYESASLDPAKKVRILLVPGHNPDYGGAEFKDLRTDQETIAQNVAKIITVVEHDVAQKIGAIFDFREIQIDYNQKTELALERIEAKVEVLQLETSNLRRIK